MRETVAHGFRLRPRLAGATLLGACLIAFAGASIGWRQPVAVLEPPMAQQPAQHPFDPAVDAIVRKSGRFVGGVVVVVRDGRIVHLQGYGLADATRRTAVDPLTSRFRIGSISKVVTGIAAARMVQEGRLSLDAPANRYLGAGALKGPWGGDVLVRHLLTHEAGFQDLDFELNAPPGGAAPREQALPVPQWKPGTTIAYSNYSAATMGKVISHAAGEPFTQYARRNVLEPLGMQEASYIGVRPDASDTRQYSVTYDGRLVESPLYGRTPYFAPSGGLKASGADMARLLLALDDPSVAAGDPLLQGALRAVGQPLRPKRYGDATPRAGYFIWNESQGGERLLAHGGASGRFESQLTLAPSRHVGVFVSLNSGSGRFGWRNLMLGGVGARAKGLTSASRLARTIIDHELGAPRLPPFVSATVPGAPGFYLSSRRAVSTIEAFQNSRATRVGSVTATTLTADGERYYRTGPREYHTRDNSKSVAFDPSGASIQTNYVATARTAPPWRQWDVQRSLFLWSAVLLLLLAFVAPPSAGSASWAPTWLAGSFGLLTFWWPQLGLDLETLRFTVQESWRQDAWAALGLVCGLAALSAIGASITTILRPPTATGASARVVYNGIVLAAASSLLVALYAFNFIGWHVRP